MGRPWVAGALLFVSACAGSYDWRKEGASVADRDHDIKACVHEADLATAAVDPYTKFARMSPMVDDCLELKGWRNQAAPKGG